jgi:VanZ family protein
VAYNDPKQSKAAAFLRYHVPAILFASAILTVSNIPNLRGPDLRFIPFDKLAHFLEYAVFSFLTFRSVSHFTPTIKNRTVFIIALVILAIFAGVDEYFQRFVPGRVSDFADYIADLTGAFLVLLFFALRRWRLGEN